MESIAINKNASTAPVTYLDELRVEELRLVQAVLLETAGAGSRLLEIGAGTGIQGYHLQQIGYDVTAVDLPESLHKTERVYPIVEYDGTQLPFANDSFDLIYSSNVLEHVEQFEALQEEQKRVLRCGGRCIHLVPSGWWAACTLFGYWLTLPTIVVRKWIRHSKGDTPIAGRGAGTSTEHQSQHNAFRSGVTALARRLFPEAHGVFATHLFEEISVFSHKSWVNRFEVCGWHVDQHLRVGLFYTGHALLERRLSWAMRRRFGKLGLGACHCYVLSTRQASGT